jgi:hypothetical protein
MQRLAVRLLVPQEGKVMASIIVRSDAQIEAARLRAQKAAFAAEVSGDTDDAAETAYSLLQWLTGNDDADPTAEMGEESRKQAVLALHLASMHADPMAMQREAGENDDQHEHEHDGPCTIRNHPRASRQFDLAKAYRNILELAE